MGKNFTLFVFGDVSEPGSPDNKPPVQLATLESKLPFLAQQSLQNVKGNLIQVI